MLKTNSGFHIGFILETAVWNNDIENNHKIIKIKQNLLTLFKGDSIATMKQKGIMRNPFSNPSIYNLKSFNLNELLNYTNKLNPIQSLNEISFIAPKSINTNKWINIDKLGAVSGNRNNYLFKKILGIRYNNDLSADDIKTILDNTNKKLDEPLKQNEINSIFKSVMKYEITKNYNKSKDNTKSKWKKGELWNNLNKLNIHNYKENGKEVFIRQKIGQITSTQKRNANTLEEIIKAHTELLKEHKVRTNQNVVDKISKSLRTLQRYYNDKGLKQSIQNEAFKLYLNTLFIVNDTPLKMTTFINENLEYFFEYKDRKIELKMNTDRKIELYEQIDEIAA